MYLKNYFYAFLVTLFSISHCATTELPLPQSLSQYAIYHIRVKQLHEFSCGYNALFNGCNVEKWCGYDNRMSDFSKFRQVSYDFAAAHKLRRKSTLGNVHIEQLAGQLGMERVVHLYIKNKQVIPLISEGVSVSYMEGTSQAEIDRMLQLAFLEQQKECIQSLKTELLTASHFPFVMHFMCIVFVEGTNHGIMISLIKNKTGTGLYIFDNMNKRITDSSDIKKIAQYIAETFSVSPRQAFKGPILPSEWPSLKAIDWELASHVGQLK